MKIPVIFLIPSTALLLVAAGCNKTTLGHTQSTFIDVHEFGPGKVKAADVAKAHQADLAVEGKRGVRFIDYWVDEEHGTVYCLSEAKDAASVIATHREAHGLLPDRIAQVSSGSTAADAAAGASGAGQDASSVQ